MNRPVIMPLGGFLGAGKTTLIIAAARILREQGIRAAAILNDQGSDLVDTRLVEQYDVAADQVTGGCFCCRYSDLVDAIERVERYQPQVIFAEAVGSCTDLSATTIQPLRQTYRVAPFTVLVDPARIPMDEDVAFLYHNQIAEADLVCYTKSDLYSAPPGGRRLSAKTGEGVAEWLHEILAGEIPLRNTILDIDYARYARAEAALAWLNCRVDVRPSTALSPAMLAGPVMDRLCAEVPRIAHLKLLNQCATGYIKAAVTGNGEEPRVEGALDASPCGIHDLLLNIRAAGDPEALRHVVERALGAIEGAVTVRTFECFRPAPPAPQRRISAC